MNKVILMGRMTKDADVRYGGADNTAIARFNLAVDRQREGTDFIKCVAFGKNAEFFEKYGKKGMKFLIEGRIQTGTYTDSKGETVYTTDVVVERQEFAESKKVEDKPQTSSDGFMAIPDEVDDFMPFN